MLDRRPPRPSLPLLANQIEHWGLEADRCRSAATAGRRSGRNPSSDLVGATQDAQHGLLMLLDQTAHDLEILDAGHPDFGPLLVAQVSITSLLECISRSLDQMGEPPVFWPVSRPLGTWEPIAT